MTTKYPVLLDSGTSLLNAPKSIADKMASFVNASYSADEGIYILDCPESTYDVEYTFDFGDLQINVPLTSLILSPETEGGYCGFAVQPTNDSMVLGDVFLSSAYVVFDLDNYKISLAQANWNASNDSKQLVNIPTDGSIPSGKSATAQPWSTNVPFTVTSDIYASAVCKTTLSSPQQTDASSIPQTSIQARNSTTRVVGARSTTTLSKTTQTGVTNQEKSTDIESTTLTPSTPYSDAKSSDSELIIETESLGRKSSSSPTHSTPQTTVDSTATKSSPVISISVGKSINRPTHKTIITETVTKYSTVVINVCKPTF
ncbi:hypothetical protein N7582_003026 [Saccharomyces uvarum]|nr:hypothetical protein N7582_003026 [Saccharomyces uvarum]